ncbi:MAG: aldehyde dehydrogenase family protein [Anaerolineae bacterium]
MKEIFDTMEYGTAPESAATAKDWIGDHANGFGLYIDGKFVQPDGAKMMKVTAPATGETLAEVVDGTTSDVAAAFTAASKAQKKWAKTSDHERAKVLYAIARGIQKHDRLLAVVEALDNGKTIRETRDIDVPLVARHFYYHAGWAQIMSIELPNYKPVGVVGQIIPWNFPLLMLAWKVAPAVAMGNAVVLKPAPATPLTALLFAEIAAEAGLPAGLLNIITGGDEAGKAIVGHGGFDKLAFTGSTDVGRIIRQQTAGTGVKLSLELGGKSPFIVFEDADLDGAVEGVVDAIWFNQGEVCCAGSRLLVQESVATQFYAKLKRRMDTLRVGHSLDKNIDMGAVVDQQQKETIEKWIATGVAEGAELYQCDYELPGIGCFVPPTLLTNVLPASSVFQEEIFGPVLVSMTFRFPAEAVALANNTRYGLAASIWSENINLALDIATKIKAGSVWVNSTNLFDAAAGFGGYRESGYGREGGREGLFEYVKAKGSKSAKPEIDPASLEDWGARSYGRPGTGTTSANGLVDRTAKLYIGGKQARPDGHYMYPVKGPKGELVGRAGDGNRKDIRNAVEAAHKAKGWADRTPHNRAQILFYMAENLAARAGEFAGLIAKMTGRSQKSGLEEVEASISRLFTYAAYADKHGGSVQETTLYGLVVSLNEPVGVIGIACPDEHPLLGFVSLLAPAICKGNTTVVIPSETHPLSATDFYQILDTSDLPGGVVNIVTGGRDHLTKTLAEHDDVDAMWYFGDAAGSLQVEAMSAGNMKRTWVSYGRKVDWLDEEQAAGEAFLREASQVKNVWVPMGE